MLFLLDHTNRYSIKIMALCTLLIIFSVQRFVLGTSSSNGVFSIEPSDVTVEVGGNATFKCQTQNCKRISWISYEGEANGPSSSATIYRATNARKGVVVRFQDCVSTLLLVNVRPKQAGNLSCSTSSSIRSNSARLTVIQPPTPICAFSPETPMVNDTVVLACRVPDNAKVPTLLSWYPARTDARGCLLAESRVVEPGSTSLVKRHLHESDNYEGFICIAGWGRSQGPNCSVTPLKVQVGNVTVAIAKKYRRENGMVDLHLECRPEAALDMVHYSWTVREGIRSSSSSVSFSGVQDVGWTETSRLLTISNCMSFSSLIVTCSALSDVGLNATSEPLNVSHCEQQDNPETFNSFDLYMYIWVILAVFVMIVISALCLYLNAKHPIRAPSGTLPTTDNDSPNARRGCGNSTSLTATASPSQRSITISEYATVGDPCFNPKPPAVPPPRKTSCGKSETAPRRTAKQSKDTEAHQRMIQALYAKPNNSKRSIESVEMSQYATISPQMNHS